MNVVIAHIYGIAPKTPRFRQDLTNKERDDWGNLLLLCHAHHSAIDDSTTGEQEYPADTLLEWKRRREARISVQLTGEAPPQGLEQLLSEYFEKPGERLVSLINRLCSITMEAEQTGRLSSDAAQELRLVVAMLSEADGYRVAESAAAVHEAAGALRAVDLGQTVAGLAAAAERISSINLGGQIDEAAERMIETLMAHVEESNKSMTNTLYGLLGSG